MGPVLALLVLNLLDAAFTNAFLASGLMTEANPLMRAAWESSPGVFLAAKLALVNLGTLALWMGRRRLLPAMALLVCLSAYSAVIVYHLLLVGTEVLSRAGVLP